ncbi:gp53-like domain-containing protein [Megamonas funiformis]|uniref:gp53-like domain-containing protein n=1 Tax=Megamonas funiformis TaxID=437897 RepID=UPI003F6A55B6
MAQKQFFVNEIGNLNILLLPTPHCRLCEQWGYYAQANNTYNFPITFPNKCFNVILQYTDSANEICLAVISLSNKQFKSVCKGYNGVYRNSPIYMFSIGF